MLVKTSCSASWCTLPAAGTRSWFLSHQTWGSGTPRGGAQDTRCPWFAVNTFGEKGAISSISGRSDRQQGSNRAAWPSPTRTHAVPNLQGGQGSSGTRCRPRDLTCQAQSGLEHQSFPPLPTADALVDAGAASLHLGDQQGAVGEHGGPGHAGRGRPQRGSLQDVGHSRGPEPSYRSPWNKRGDLGAQPRPPSVGEAGWRKKKVGRALRRGDVLRKGSFLEQSWLLWEEASQKKGKGGTRWRLGAAGPRGIWHPGGTVLLPDPWPQNHHYGHPGWAGRCPRLWGSSCTGI